MDDARDEDSVVIQCPCIQFSDTNEIYRALQSEERTKQVIEWISEGSSLKPGTRLSCNPSPPSRRCANRVNASFSILNDIRHACRSYLEPAQTPSDQTGRPAETYETSFPTLSSGSVSSTTNTLIARKKPKQKKKVSLTASAQPKRRIRPLQASTLKDGNISSIPSEESLPTINSLMLKIAQPPDLSKGITGDIVSKEEMSVFQSPIQQSLTSRPVSSGKPLTPWQKQGPEDTPNESGTVVQCEAELRTTNRSTRSTLEESSTARKPWNSDANIDGIQSQSTQVVAKSLPHEIGRQTPLTKKNPVWASHSSSKEVGKTSMKELTPVMDPVQIDNVSSLYTTLILNNLVPSTPLELHLLVGLLTVKESATRPKEIHLLRSILVSPIACRAFAVKSLTKLKTILGNLHLQVLAAFVECPPVRELVPDLVEELSARLQERQTSLVITDTGIGGGMQPILALPFDKARDSRHNYKSQAESALYKNREESRDAFLYQLRHFQNVRGRVVDTSQLDSALLKIRQGARNVVQGVQTPNMHWFAQLFSDLLLQLGLVPMEETDKDLLSITDKEKLQKLHKRFSSKVGPSKGSSTKVLSDTRDGRTPEKEAHQFFPGHQEFFFLFIRAADSYSFGVHLKSRLTAVAESFGAQLELKGLQDRLLKHQLVGKFLGVLQFSQNWHKSNLSGVLNAISSAEIQIWTRSADLYLPLLELVEVAQQEHRLLVTVPWILEILRMAKWDTLSMRSIPMESLFAKLASVQEASRGSSNPNLQLVSLCIESFFHQVVGLRRVHSLPRAVTTLAVQNPEKAVDLIDLRLSNNFLFSSISHMDELLSLLTSIASTRAKSIGAPRKMRPSMVSTSLSSFSSSTEDSMPSLPSPSQSNQATSLDAKSRTVGKLVDMFFHQNGELKEICEFVADRATLKATVELQESFLPDQLRQVEYHSSDRVEALRFRPVEEEMLAKCCVFFEGLLKSAIYQSVTSLCPSNKSAKVIEIAAKLATDHAMKLADPQIRKFIKAEVKKHFDAFLRKEKKRMESAKHSA